MALEGNGGGERTGAEIMGGSILDRVNERSEVVTPTGDVLGRLESAAAADVASVEASRQTYPQAEVPEGGLAERVDMQRGAELAEGEDNREVVIRVVTSLERAVANVQPMEGEKPEEYKYRLGLALHEAAIAAVDQFPAKPTPSSGEFK